MKISLLLNLTSILSIISFCSCDNCGLKNQSQKSTEQTETITLKSGLKYKTLQHGHGSIVPKTGQKVSVHYTGWIGENGKRGKKFDSSIDHGKKFTFTIGIGQVIKGWDEGVVSMKVGEKRELTIPYNLAYGERGIPGAIPPKSTLIFEVELLEIF